MAAARTIQYFFAPQQPHRYLLGVSHARKVHGGMSVGLYYYPGFRSSQYTVAKGVRLNEPGDTNPFPQAFVFISGSGFALIGSDTVRVKAGESYLIPAGTDHVVWNESDEPLVLIWLAWGPGA